MQSQLTQSELLTPAETAELLRVSPQTLRRYAAERRLEAVRLTARTLRYRRASVEALIASGGAGDPTTTEVLSHA